MVLDDSVKQTIIDELKNNGNAVDITASVRVLNGVMSFIDKNLPSFLTPKTTTKTVIQPSGSDYSNLAARILTLEKGEQSDKTTLATLLSQMHINTQDITQLQTEYQDLSQDLNDLNANNATQDELDRAQADLNEHLSTLATKQLALKNTQDQLKDAINTLSSKSNFGEGKEYTFVEDMANTQSKPDNANVFHVGIKGSHYEVQELPNEEMLLVIELHSKQYLMAISAYNVNGAANRGFTSVTADNIPNGLVFMAN